MKSELAFLKGLNYSKPFRQLRGFDSECDLSENEINDISNGPGVYIIVATQRTKFVYPKGNSPVIYIGKADNLRRRLREHLRNLSQCVDNEIYDLSKHIQHCSRYWYFHYFGAHVYTYNCLKNTQDAKNLESEIIWRFYEKYRSLPVGNGARSFGKD